MRNPYPEKSDTPRTDAILAEISTFFDSFRKVDRMLLDHARKLERELNNARAAYAMAQGLVTRMLSESSSAAPCDPEEKK